LTASELHLCLMVKFGILFVAESAQADMPDLLGHSVGPERWELLSRLAGNEVLVLTFFIQV